MDRQKVKSFLPVEDPFAAIGCENIGNQATIPCGSTVDLYANPATINFIVTITAFNSSFKPGITDLLDPSQRNLQIREDVNSVVYVENLTEECVSTMKDVTQLLMKGLSNRRTGATSINAESSRSHSVFTCAVKSRCKAIRVRL
ncbi:Kinesin-like protein KIN-12A [Camellia lanceoleosa]|nr:Kinesin-like protein KIN-12A [Camellia lanceoleosa]